LFVSPVNLIGFDHLSIWPDLVLGTEVEALLSSFHTTDEGASNGLSCHDKTELVNGVRGWSSTNLNKDTVLFKKG